MLTPSANCVPPSIMSATRIPPDISTLLPTASSCAASPPVVRPTYRHDASSRFGIGQFLHAPPQIIPRHARIRVAGHQRLVLRRLAQRRHRPHLRIGKPRLAAGQKPRPHLRMLRRNPLRHLQARVALVPRAEQQLILRIVQLEEPLQIFFQVRLRPMQRLQHAHRRQKVRGRPLLAPLAPGKTHRAHQHHPAIDSSTSPCRRARRKTESAGTNSSHLFSQRSPNAAPSACTSRYPV